MNMLKMRAESGSDMVSDHPVSNYFGYFDVQFAF